jgi:hypothetical protein
MGVSAGLKLRYQTVCALVTKLTEADWDPQIARSILERSVSGFWSHIHYFVTGPTTLSAAYAQEFFLGLSEKQPSSPSFVIDLLPH